MVTILVRGVSVRIVCEKLDLGNGKDGEHHGKGRLGDGERRGVRHGQILGVLSLRCLLDF